jgi:hypothetical protein
VRCRQLEYFYIRGQRDYYVQSRILSSIPLSGTDLTIILQCHNFPFFSDINGVREKSKPAPCLPFSSFLLGERSRNLNIMTSSNPSFSVQLQGESWK